MKYENVILGTGNYDNIKAGNPVSIAYGNSSFWGFYGKECQQIGPDFDTERIYKEKINQLINMRKDIRYYQLKEQMIEEYIFNYYTHVLKNINLEELFEFLKENYGDYIILVSNRNEYNICPRRILADYLELKTGISFPEIQMDSLGSYRKVTLKDQDYKKQLKKLIENNY